MKRKGIISGIIAAAVVVLAAIISICVFAAARSSLPGAFAEIEAADTCDLRWELFGTTAVELTLTEEHLTGLKTYLASLEVTETGHGAEEASPKGEYTLTFYKKNEQIAQMTLSHAGEVGISQSGTADFSTHQVKLDAGKPLYLPVHEWREWDEVNRGSALDNPRLEMRNANGEDNLDEFELRQYEWGRLTQIVMGAYQKGKLIVIDYKDGAASAIRVRDTLTGEDVYAWPEGRESAQDGGALAP